MAPVAPVVWVIVALAAFLAVVRLWARASSRARGRPGRSRGWLRAARSQRRVRSAPRPLGSRIRPVAGQPSVGPARRQPVAAQPNRPVLPPRAPAGACRKWSSSPPRTPNVRRTGPLESCGAGKKAQSPRRFGRAPRGVRRGIRRRSSRTSSAAVDRLRPSTAVAEGTGPLAPPAGQLAGKEAPWAKPSRVSETHRYGSLPPALVQIRGRLRIGPHLQRTIPPSNGP